jgi:hypothetical protein
MPARRPTAAADRCGGRGEGRQENKLAAVRLRGGVHLIISLALSLLIHRLPVALT